MASKTSAVADEPIEVLFALHPKFNLLDFAGPLEVLTTAQHDAQDPSEFATDPSLLRTPHSPPRLWQARTLEPDDDRSTAQWASRDVREPPSAHQSSTPLAMQC